MECLPPVAIVPRPIPVNPAAPPPAPPARRSRWRRWLGIAAAVLAAGVVVTALTFPTDEIVRGVLARVTPSSGPTLVFEHAVLRPWGLRLDGPAVRRPDGGTIFSAEWVRIRPSLRGLLRDGTGRPWRIASAVCGGTVDADVTVDHTAATIDASWIDLDLGTCLPPLASGLTIAGRVTGHAVARAGDGTSPSGRGELHVRDALWEQDEAPLPGLDALQVDAAAMRWTVAEERLLVEGLELRGPELELQGGGTVRLTGSTTRNALDLELTVIPGPEASEDLVRALEKLPRAPGPDPLARSLVVKGTVGQPVVVTR